MSEEIKIEKKIYYTQPTKNLTLIGTLAVDINDVQAFSSKVLTNDEGEDKNYLNIVYIGGTEVIEDNDMQIYNTLLNLFNIQEIPNKYQA